MYNPPAYSSFYVEYHAISWSVQYLLASCMQRQEVRRLNTKPHSSKDEDPKHSSKSSPDDAASTTRTDGFSSKILLPTTTGMGKPPQHRQSQGMYVRELMTCHWTRPKSEFFLYWMSFLFPFLSVRGAHSVKNPATTGGKVETEGKVWLTRLEIAQHRSSNHSLVKRVI